MTMTIRDLIDQLEQIATEEGDYKPVYIQAYDIHANEIMGRSFEPIDDIGVYPDFVAFLLR